MPHNPQSKLDNELQTERDDERSTVTEVDLVGDDSPYASNSPEDSTGLSLSPDVEAVLIREEECDFLPEIPPALRPHTNRELHREIWTLAWPSVLTMLLQTFNSLMDVFFVGHLPDPAQALAATGVGGSVLFILIALAMGVSIGATALTARFTGADDHENCIRAAGQAVSLSFVFGLIFGTLTYLGRSTLAGWLLGASVNPQAAHLCVSFLSTALLASVPLFVMNAVTGIFRGLGDTRTPMRITAVMIATHIGFNYLLIFGRYGFPRLGVAGAGLAFATSIWAAATLYLIALSRRHGIRAALKRRHLALQREWAVRILRVGAPAAIQALIRNLGMMSFTGMLARSADAASGVAALQIGVRAEAIAFMPGFGYSVAAAALVGQSLGAKDVKRAERYGWGATGQAMLIMAFMAMIFFALASPFAGLFTQDSMVRRLGADYLRVNACCEPFLALGMVLTGALQGAGDTARPTYITIFTMWIVRLPLAYLLMSVLSMQAHGAWISMATTTIIGGLMTVALFRTGKWKLIRV